MRSVCWRHSPIAHEANPTMTALAASPAFGALTSSSASSSSPTVALKNDTSSSFAKMNALHSSIYGANSHILTREAQNPSVAATACSRTSIRQCQVHCTLAADVHTRDQDDVRVLKGHERPDSFGRYGIYGGKYVPETLMAALSNLEEGYRATIKDPEFQVGIDFSVSVVKFGFLTSRNAERLLNNSVRISRCILLPHHYSSVYRGSLLEPETYDKFCFCLCLCSCLPRVFIPLDVLRFKEGLRV